MFWKLTGDNSKKLLLALQLSLAPAEDSSVYLLRGAQWLLVGVVFVQAF